MKSYSPDTIRNVCLLSHGGIGKTTLLEALTYTTKASTRLGRTDQGTSMFDTREDEKERGTTIGIKSSFVEWQNKKINILDTPGFEDFMGEVKSAVKVVESAVVLIDAMDGVQVGTERVCMFVEEAGLPKIFFINKIDKENAKYDDVLQMLIDNFGTSVAPIQIPLGQSANFKGVIDLISMEAYTYEPNGSGIGKKEAIPDNMKEHARELRNKLMEAVAESDEALMNKYFEAGELSQEELISGLNKGFMSGEIYPVLCGSAVNNMGTDLLLNTMANLCPLPTAKEIKAAINGSEITIRPDANDPLSAFVYKTVSEEHMGEITFIRVYSGTLKSGIDVFNVNTNTTERIGNLYAMRGMQRNDIQAVGPGDFCATLKLKDTHTGNSLVDKTRILTFSPIDFPTPLTEKAIYPKSKGDEEKISNGLSRLHEEDPVFLYGYKPDIKQTIISGMGDVHIDVLTKVLKKRFGVDVELKEPRIPYHEAIKGKSEAQYRHKKQTGGRGQYGEVYIRVEPLPRGSGFEFEDAVVGGAIPGKYIPAVEKGIVETMKNGVLVGYEILDLKVTLYDGSYHDVDSSDMSFKIAGSMAFKDAFARAKPVLLEPIYDVEVMVPEIYTGDVMGDLSSRRGKIGGMERKGKYQIITAKLPLAELSNYAQSLRSFTQGQGMYSRKFSHYEEIPAEISFKLIDEMKKLKAAETEEKA